MLRAPHKLTLSITAVLTGFNYRSAHATFTITVKAPARAKR